MAGWMLFEIMYISVIGASFCHVVIRSAVCSVVPCNTSGSQKWIGAAPIFIVRAKVMIVVENLFLSSKMSQLPVCQALVVLARSIIADAIACVRKYLVVASDARVVFGFEMTGRMANMFSSSPTQAMSQLELDMVVIVPIIILRVIIVMAGGVMY